jgi:hypothetical protein
MTPADEAAFIALWTRGLTTAAEADRPPKGVDSMSPAEPQKPCGEASQQRATYEDAVEAAAADYRASRPERLLDEEAQWAAAVKPRPACPPKPQRVPDFTTWQIIYLLFLWAASAMIGVVVLAIVGGSEWEMWGWLGCVVFFACLLTPTKYTNSRLAHLRENVFDVLALFGGNPR